MAWKAEIIFGDGDVEGFNSIETVYDSTLQTAYKLKYGAKFGNQAPDIIYHNPDNAPRIPARATDAPAQIFLTIHSKATDWDTVFNNNNKISRLINGANSQALRANVNGTAESVKVKVTPPGATNSTYYTVQSGFMDMSSAYTTPDAFVNKEGREIVIALECDAGGKGEPFTLRNDLPSSPHFIEDSNSDGVADGWSIQGAVTATIDTDIYLVGGKSQKCIAPGSINGILSTLVTSTGTSGVAYAWVYVESGEAVVRFRDITAGANISFLVVNDNNADMTEIGSTGEKWLRISIGSESLTPSNIYRLDVLAYNGASTFYADATFVQFGVSDVPNGWCSSSSLKNRYDPTSTSAATQQQINYLDVWGIPGDLPAYVKQTFTTNSSTDAQSLIVAGRYGGRISPLEIGHFFDSADNSYTFNVSTVTDATRIGGSYLSMSTSSTNRTYFSIPSSQEPYFADETLRLFAVMQTTGSGGFGRVTVRAGGVDTQVVTSDISPETINTWSIVDMGTINLTGALPDISTIGGVDIELFFEAGGSSGNLYLDGLYVIPVGQILFTKLDDVDNNYIINGRLEETAIEKNGSYILNQSLGSFRHLLPSEGNRILYISRGDDSSGNIEEHDIDTEFTVELEITPRTSHLLGTA